MNIEDIIKEVGEDIIIKLLNAIYEDKDDIILWTRDDNALENMDINIKIYKEDDEEC